MISYGKIQTVARETCSCLPQVVFLYMVEHRVSVPELAAEIVSHSHSVTPQQLAPN